MENRFGYPHYTVRRKVIKLFGGAFHIYNPNDEVMFYANLKAFKLKEDIRLYTGEDMQTQVLSIKARQAIDFSATYDVFDALENTKVGALRRKGLKSMLKDEWIIIDSEDKEIGLIKEESLGLALLRRFITGLVPQKYYAMIDGLKVCTFKQNINPFVMKIIVDFSHDDTRLFDKRLGIAASILLCSIEGKQG
jgi:uncharacterized protein YxjI